VGDLQDHEAALLVERGDASEDAAARDDLVALLQLREHLLGLLLLLAHGRDEQEVEDDEDEDHREELHESSRGAAGRRGGLKNLRQHSRRIISNPRQSRANSKVLTPRILLTGVLVGEKGPDSSLPSEPKIWICPWLAERIPPTRAPESAANCWAMARAFFV